MSEEHSSTTETIRKPSTPKIVRRIIRKKEEASGIVDKYWQPALVLLGLAVSGTVAYKVFFSGKSKQKQQEEVLANYIQQLQQQIRQSQSQQAPQLVAQDPSQIIPVPNQHPIIPNFVSNGGGNGHQLHNGNGHAMQQQQQQMYQKPTEAMSSYAERMLRTEQFKQIPIYEDRGHSQQADTRDLGFAMNKHNIPVHSAHNIPSPPPLPTRQQVDHSNDIA